MHSIALLFTLNALLIVCLQVPLSHWFEKYDALSMTAISAFAYSFGFSILLTAHSFAIAIISCIIYTFAEMVFFALCSALCIENAPSQKKGLYYGIYQTSYALSLLVGPLLGGFIYQNFNGTALWGSCGVLGVLCFCGGLWLYQEKHFSGDLENIPPRQKNAAHSTTGFANTS
jgi:MFS family permease